MRSPPSPPEQHPRCRNTGRALAPPLLSANLLYKTPAPCPAKGAGWPAYFRSAMVKDRPRAIAPSKPSLQPAPSAPNPVHIPHAVTPGGAVLHPVGANPQPAAPLARFQPALWQSRRGCRLSDRLYLCDRPQQTRPTAFDSLPPPHLHPGHGLLLGEQRGGRVRCQFWLPSFYVGWRGRSPLI